MGQKFSLVYQDKLEADTVTVYEYKIVERKCNKCEKPFVVSTPVTRHGFPVTFIPKRCPECDVPEATAKEWEEHLHKETPFAEEVLAFVESIEGFHERFKVETGIGVETGGVHSIERWRMLEEEHTEYRNEIVFTSNRKLELAECADIAFVALGTLQLAGEEGITALRNVLMKNNKKSWITHFRDKLTGKITRINKDEIL